MTDLAPELVQTAFEILSLGRNGHSIEDFLTTSMLLPIAAGVNHRDRVRIYELLVRDGSIFQEAGYFWTSTSTIPRWLVTGAASGYLDSEVAAEIFHEEPVQKRKFDAELLAEIGLNGEQAFVSHLSEAAPAGAHISHVSLFDDSLGYDVELLLPEGRKYQFEVKTTTKDSAQFRFFLSRNEFEVAQRLGSSWNIALIRLLAGKTRVEGLMGIESLEAGMPLERSAQIKWESVSCSTDLQNLRGIQELLTPPAIQSS